MKSKRPEINSGSMADIAFLLLIFFLVATTIDQDKGLLRRLPRIVELPKLDVRKRNVLAVYVNANNLLMVNNAALEINDLAKVVKGFVSNNGKKGHWSESPQTAVVSIKASKGTDYKTYIAVQNEIARAYRELRDSLSQKKFGKLFSELKNKQEIKQIKSLLPMNISETGLED